MKILVNSLTFRSEQDITVMEAVMVSKLLLLHKTSFISKQRYNVETVKRRLNQWKDGEIENLLI